ncbi:hypothetical protein J6590_030489 [Homalodisca vitripennis]|nr:hypothetical protein J6590_030489 [Homalodisca vitripennis]
MFQLVSCRSRPAVSGSRVVNFGLGPFERGRGVAVQHCQLYRRRHRLWQAFKWVIFRAQFGRAGFLRHSWDRCFCLYSLQRRGTSVVSLTSTIWLAVAVVLRVSHFAQNWSLSQLTRFVWPECTCWCGVSVLSHFDLKQSVHVNYSCTSSRHRTYSRYNIDVRICICTAERSFSTKKLVRNLLRIKMGPYSLTTTGKPQLSGPLPPKSLPDYIVISGMLNLECCRVSQMSRWPAESGVAVQGGYILDGEITGDVTAVSQPRGKSENTGLLLAAEGALSQRCFGVKIATLPRRHDKNTPLERRVEINSVSKDRVQSPLPPLIS